jgi:hypothetical protein
MTKNPRKPQKRKFVKTERRLTAACGFGSFGGGTAFSDDEGRLLFMGKNYRTDAGFITAIN